MEAVFREQGNGKVNVKEGRKENQCRHVLELVSTWATEAQFQ